MAADEFYLNAVGSRVFAKWWRTRVAAERYRRLVSGAYRAHRAHIVHAAFLRLRIATWRASTARAFSERRLASSALATWRSATQTACRADEFHRHTVLLQTLAMLREQTAAQRADGLAAGHDGARVTRAAIGAWVGWAESRRIAQHRAGEALSCVARRSALQPVWEALRHHATLRQTRHALEAAADERFRDRARMALVRAANEAAVVLLERQVHRLDMRLERERINYRARCGEAMGSG